MGEVAVTRAALRQALLAAAAQLGQGPPGPGLWVRRAAPERGEFESNIALLLAPLWGRAAPAIAAELKAWLQAQGLWPGRIDEVKGFLNFRMDDAYLQSQVTRAVAEGAAYGAGQSLAGRRINVEFVSADPTGPLSLVAARSAAVGEALCRLVAFQGGAVTREFFLNDVENSSTMRLLGESVDALYRAHFGQGGETPEGALHDAFVRGVAGAVAQHEGNRYLLVPEAERTAAFAHRARDAAVELQRKLLHQVGVDFDVWTSESALHQEGRVTAAVQKLRDRGHVYEKDGAQYLRTTAFGDEVDRPLVRANGRFTYLASDIAYHSLKFERGFDLLLNVWTVQHGPYVTRTRAALEAAGFSAEALEVKLLGGARLLSDGEPVTESDGGALTLATALREVERDRLWLHLLAGGWEDDVDIELDIARRDDESNPAYAALLAPSRLATMRRAAQGDDGPWVGSERGLARLVALWPDEAQTAAAERDPQRLVRFVSELGLTVRDLLAQGDKVAHPTLLQAAATTASNALRLLGIEAREKF